MRVMVAAVDEPGEITPPGLTVDVAEHASSYHNSSFAAMAKKKNTAGRKLVAIECFFIKAKRIVFHYREGRWEFFETFKPCDIREALKVSLEIIDEEFPGVLARAAELDDREWQANRRRTRRYIAEHPEIIYIDSPHLRDQVETVRGFYLPTNIPWRDVPRILSLVCKAASIRYGGLSNIHRAMIMNPGCLQAPTSSHHQLPHF